MECVCVLLSPSTPLLVAAASTAGAGGLVGGVKGCHRHQTVVRLLLVIVQCRGQFLNALGVKRSLANSNAFPGHTDPSPCAYYTNIDLGSACSTCTSCQYYMYMYIMPVLHDHVHVHDISTFIGVGGQ